MKRNRDFGLSIGAPSIVVIMVILCLVCFAGLSIVSANADLTLSRKLAERTSAYYQACNEAQEDLWEASKKEPLEDSFSCDYVMNENQILSVNASFSQATSGERTYTITLPRRPRSWISPYRSLLATNTPWMTVRLLV